ncbi:hypothetical protein B0H14DRAFT_2581882 [Mycena olivaceomarginata]|nr:hypothetical protein B0H14DRAFT_2581882 [Mycena olivaceomarginata]
MNEHIPARFFLKIHIWTYFNKSQDNELGGRMSSPSNIKTKSTNRVKGEVCNEGAAVFAVIPEGVEYSQISPQWKECVDKNSYSNDGVGAGAEEHGEGKEGSVQAWSISCVRNVRTTPSRFEPTGGVVVWGADVSAGTPEERKLQRQKSWATYSHTIEWRTHPPGSTQVVTGLAINGRTHPRVVAYTGFPEFGIKYDLDEVRRSSVIEEQQGKVPAQRRVGNPIKTAQQGVVGLRTIAWMLLQEGQRWCGVQWQLQRAEGEGGQGGRYRAVTTHPPGG